MPTETPMTPLTPTPSEKLGGALWKGALLKTKVAMQKTPQRSNLSLQLSVIAGTHGVARKHLVAVCNILNSFRKVPVEESEHRDPVKDVQAWVETGDLAEPEEPTAQSIEAALNVIIKSQVHRNGVGKVASMVVAAMCAAGPKAEVAHALVMALEQDPAKSSGQESTSMPRFADGLAEPSRLNRKTPPKDVEFYPQDFIPAVDPWGCTAGMRDWVDPRGKQLWPPLNTMPSHDPTDDLLGNCRLILERHAAGYGADVVIPIHTYSHEAHYPVCYSLWVYDKGGRADWTMVKDFRDLELAFHNRKEDGFFDLTSEASRGLIAELSESDQAARPQLKQEGRWNCGRLSKMQDSHGTVLFKHTLARSLPSGLDSLYVVRYTQCYRDTTKFSNLGPLSDAVSWIPPVWQALHPGPFGLGSVPPASVLEYIYARGATEAISTEDWAVQVTGEKDTEYKALVEACGKEKNQQKYNERLHKRAENLIEAFARPIQVVHNVVWRPLSAPEQEWSGVAFSDLRAIATSHIKEPYHVLVWEEEKGRQGSGRAWLVNGMKPLEGAEVPSGAIFFQSQSLPVSWKGDGVEEIKGETPSHGTYSKCNQAKRICKNLRFAALLMTSKGVHRVDLRRPGLMLPSSSDHVVLPDRRLDQADIAPTLMFSMFRAKVGGTHPTPQLIADALSLQSLRWNDRCYLLALSGKRPVLADVASEEMSNYSRITYSMENQPYWHINFSMRELQAERLDAELQITEGPAAGLYLAKHPAEAPGSRSAVFMQPGGRATAHWDAQKDCWSLFTPDSIHVPDHSTKLNLHAWMLPQVRILIYYLDKALQQLPPPPSFTPTYRGLAGVVLPMDTYERASVVLWGAYSSASADQGVATVFANSTTGDRAAVFTIEGKSCRMIAQFSRFKREAEWLYPPNTRFQVVNCLTAEQQMTLGLEHVQHFELREVDLSGALEIFIRGIVPTLTHSATPDHIRDLFLIMQAIQQEDFACALRTALSPLKEVLLHEGPATGPTGVIICQQLLHLTSLSEKKRNSTEGRGKIELQHALHESARYQCTRAVPLLIELGADVNAKDENSCTALHIAAELGSSEMTDILISYGGDPKALNDRGETPLHLAVRRAAFLNEGQDILALLATPEALQLPDIYGATALHQAVEQGNSAAASLLLELGADPNTSGREPSTLKSDSTRNLRVEGLQVVRQIMDQPHYRRPSQKGVIAALRDATALHAAAQKGYVGITETLLNSGADPASLNKHDQSALHLAILSGQFETSHGLEVISRLCVPKALRQKDKKHMTPLHEAARLGMLDTVLVLLSSPHSERLATLTDDNGNTPIHLAAAAFHIDVVLALLPYANIHLTPDDFPSDKVLNAGPMLLEAIQQGNIAKVKLLLECGVDPESDDELGRTALHLAAANPAFGCEEGLKVVSRMAEKNLNRGDSLRRTPLHMAAKAGTVPIARVLMQLGANVNARDTHGESPLHLAAREGWVGMVDVLCWANRKHHADLNLCDNAGATPLHVAAALGHRQMVLALLKEGSKPGELDANGDTPLDLAAREHRMEIVYILSGSSNAVQLPPGVASDMLLSAIGQADPEEVIRVIKTFGIDVAKMTTPGKPTPLHLAVQMSGFNSQRGCEALQLLVSPGSVNALIDAPDVGRKVTPLHLAAHHGFSMVVKLLIDAGATCTARTEEGLTALQVAAGRLKMEVVRLLKDVTPIHLKNSDFPVSPLHRAAQAGDYVAARILMEEYSYLASEADALTGTPSGRVYSPSGKELVGATPLHYAVMHPAFSTPEGFPVMAMLTKDAINSHTVHLGFTPLHSAASVGSIPAIQLLLECGADTASKDSDGNTPLDIACNEGHVQATHLLRSYTHFSLIPHQKVAELEEWVYCEVQVKASQALVRKMFETEMMEKRKRKKRNGEEFLDWDIGKTFLNKKGSAVTVRDSLIELEFVENGTPTRAAFPRSAVTRLMYQNFES